MNKIKKSFIPHEYQDLAADHILQHKRVAIWAGMGMGKTSTCLHALNCLNLVTYAPVLIIAPLRVAKYVWPNEANKWQDFSNLEICPIIGTPKQREKALKQHADIFSVNYENLPWLVKTVKNKWPWGTVIADESTRLKGFRLAGSTKYKNVDIKINPKSDLSRSQYLAKATFSKVNRFIELTGTPSPNGLIDLWGQLWFLDRGERLGYTFSSFINRWFRYENAHSFTPVLMEHSKTEIINRVKDICLSIRPEDYFTLKDPIITNIKVHMPDKIKNLYKQMEKEMFIEIREKPVEAFNAASKSLKCLQIANGAIYTDAKKNWEHLHNEKLKALESIVNEAAGMPVLVAYHFKHDLARLKKAFPKAVELDAKKETEDLWNAGKIPILLTHPASAGHGLNLQEGGNIIVYFGHWWDLEQRQQILERIGPVRQMQAGLNRPVFIYNIIAAGTIDNVVLQRHKTKREIQDLLLEYATRK